MGTRMAVGVVVSLSVVVANRPASAQPVTQQMEQAFAKIEAPLNEVQQKRVITAAASQVSTALDAYTQIAYQTYTNVTEAVKRNPNQATAAQLNEFEHKIHEHAARLDKVAQQIADIHVKIRNGSIEIAEDALRNAGPQDINELKEWMQPPVRAKYRAKDPRFGVNFDWKTSPREQFAAQCEEAFPEERGSVWQTVGELLIPPAHATIAYPCVSLCSAGDTAGCVACITKAGVVQFWNNYQAQMRACGGLPCPLWNWRCYACHVAVRQAFLLILG